MTKIKLAIKNRWTGSIIFEYEKENNTLAETVKEYIRLAAERGARADLTDAYLTGAYLTRADLTGANLTGAYLTDAYLTDADLTDANLTDAYLTGAYLTRADLTDANLTDANLTDANLTGANLTGAYLTRAYLTRADLTGAYLTRAYLTDADLTDANLTDANLTGANLTGANLTGAYLTAANLNFFKYDLWAKLLMLKKEIPAFKEKMKAGQIKGTCYEGNCCCFVGTFANIRGVQYDQLPVKPNSYSPTERWFLQISEGDTPENSGVVKLTLEWIEEFELYLNA